MRRLLALLICASSAPASAQDAADVLIRLRDRIVDQGRRIPNHTCVETVERDRYQHIAEQAHRSCDTILARRRLPNFSKLSHVATTDRLRLDVLATRDREVYAWAGAPHFEQGEIDELIPEGAIGTGQFATLLLSVFEGRPPRFRFEGETALDGRAVFEYSFHISKEESRYRYKDRTQPWTVTGYGGTLLVDRETADLLRFAVQTDELPPASDSCEVDTTLDYANVELSGAEFLVPATTRQRFIGRDGTESENRYSFSSCRDFRAESSVFFGDPPSGPAPAQNRSAPTSGLPPGLSVSIELATTISSDRAAAGDRIEGRLAQPIRARDGAVLAAEGTHLAGRLMRVEIEHLPAARVTFVLRWENLEIGGVSQPLHLVPNRDAKHEYQVGGLAGIALAIANLRKRGQEIELPLPGEEKYAAVHYPGEYRVLNTGLRTEWLTVNP